MRHRAMYSHCWISAELSLSAFLKSSTENHDIFGHHVSPRGPSLDDRHPTAFSRWCMPRALVPASRRARARRARNRGRGGAARGQARRRGAPVGFARDRFTKGPGMFVGYKTRDGPNCNHGGWMVHRSSRWCASAAHRSIGRSPRAGAWRRTKQPGGYIAENGDAMGAAGASRSRLRARHRAGRARGRAAARARRTARERSDSGAGARLEARLARATGRAARAVAAGAAERGRATRAAGGSPRRSDGGRAALAAQQACGRAPRGSASARSPAQAALLQRVFRLILPTRVLRVPVVEAAQRLGQRLRLAPLRAPKSNAEPDREGTARRQRRSQDASRNWAGAQRRTERPRL